MITTTLVLSILPKNNATVRGKLFDEQPINFDHLKFIAYSVIFILFVLTVFLEYSTSFQETL